MLRYSIALTPTLHSSLSRTVLGQTAIGRTANRRKNPQICSDILPLPVIRAAERLATAFTQIARRPQDKGFVTAEGPASEVDLTFATP
jgi:hypothetical protein